LPDRFDRQHHALTIAATSAMCAAMLISKFQLRRAMPQSKSQSMEMLMDDQVSCPAPQALTDALDASVRDLASGTVADAKSVQTEARRLLADYDPVPAGSPASGRNSRRRSGTA